MSILFLLLFSFTLQAQTKLAPTQIGVRTVITAAEISPTIFVWIELEDGQVFRAKLDPATIAIDPPAAPGQAAVIRAIAPTAPALAATPVKIEGSFNQRAITLPDAPLNGFALVYVGGAAQSGVDYQISANVITFRPEVTPRGQVLQIVYWKEQR